MTGFPAEHTSAGAVPAEQSALAARTADISDTIRVLLADDHPALRVGLRVLLERVPDIIVVGEASDGKEALEQIEAARPTVVVLDCQLPEVTGIEVALAVQRRGMPTRILALSAHVDDKYVHGMTTAGASGYLVKEEAAEVIVAAVQAVARGEKWFSPAVAGQLARLRRGLRDRAALTEREIEVLRLLAQGRSNKEIAHLLKVVERTVEFHVSNVLGKLALSSRVGAAIWAKENDI